MRHERELRLAGFRRIAGIDEVGRGSLAGPVVAAAVILPERHRIKGLRDSKVLSRARREALYERILDRAEAIGVGCIEVEVIDRINILQATRLAMGQALAALDVEPELVLTDYVTVPGLRCPQRNLVEGDRRSASVAAASIIAKVTRDRIMEEADREYPVYGFGRHKGYPTPEHRTALELHGPCALHRRTFAGIWSQMVLFSGSELQWIEAD